VAQSVKRPTLISAQVMISGSWDPAPRQAPRSAGSLLQILSLSPSPLPRLAPALSRINKSLKKPTTTTQQVFKTAVESHRAL